MIDTKAVVDASANIADDVEIGPFSIIGSNVTIGSGTKVGPHVVIKGPTKIGRNNQIFQFSSIGEIPQDKKFNHEETWVEIGNNNTIREFCTINRGTSDGGSVTSIGNDNWIMAYVHIAHDCIVGNHTIFANSASLAGHVTIEDYAILGGFSLIHQFCRVGKHAFTGMGSYVNRDVPPYVTVASSMSVPRGLNTEGLKRRGFDEPRISNIKKAYKLLYKSGLRLNEALENMEELPDSHDDIALFIDFLKKSERSILR